MFRKQPSQKSSSPSSPGGVTTQKTRQNNPQTTEREWDAIQGAVNQKLTTLGVGLSPTEINYITQKIQNERRSKRLTLKLQAVQDVHGSAGTSQVPPRPVATVPTGSPGLNRERSDTPKRQADWSFAPRTQQKLQPANPSPSPRPKAPQKSTEEINPPGEEIDYKKEFHIYRERCAKMELVVKRAMEMKVKNQKLEEEIEQLKNNSGSALNNEKFLELEKKHNLIIRKKDLEITALKQKLEDIHLEKEVLVEQIEEQNRLIERLENGFKLAMDQLDQLNNEGPPEPEKQSPGTSALSTFDPYADDDDLNYEDLDEETLMKLLEQTKQALNEKKTSISFDSLDLDY
eukprot:TRINITY_DN25265_c0_g1_i1.p1 TRINITY_DN25265_c0_g1~~TRINITY_DN25265_c0_g1_i1.p1  ORF type:complete len:345 (+),score=105.43 TRINITY_DN25265_c0_g1_i1:23-1057(+)